MSLLTDELRARIGETVEYTAPEPLGRSAFRYFATAIGDDNPLYTDSEFAREHGYDDVVAPPTLICETNQYMTGVRDQDGYLGHSWHLDVPDSRLVRGGNHYRFHRPIGPDDVITARWRIADMTERTTSAGTQMLIVTSEAEYSSAGRPLVTNTETLIYTELPKAAS